MAQPENRWRSGSVAFEFALLVVPLLMLMFGVIEYGRLQWTRSALNEVAISGARCAGLAAVSCSTATSDGRTYSAEQTSTFIKAEASAWYVVLGSGNITVDGNTSCDGASNLVRVQLSYTFRSPFLAPFQSANWPVNATACFPNQS